jgi:hypothetical protein
MARLSRGSHHLFLSLSLFLSPIFFLPTKSIDQRPKNPLRPPYSTRQRPQRHHPPSLLAGGLNAAALPPCSPEALTLPPFLPALRRPQHCRCPSLLARGPNAAASRAVSEILLLGFPATLLLGMEEKARRPVRPTSLRKSGSAAVVWPTSGRL